MLRHADLVGTFQFCYLLVKKLPLIQPSFRSIDQLTFNGELIIYYAASYANHPLHVLSDEVKFLLVWSNKSDLFIHLQENWMSSLERLWNWQLQMPWKYHFGLEIMGSFVVLREVKQ